jgi:hypothetical protein
VVDSDGENKCWLWAERRGLGFVGAGAGAPATRAGRKKAILSLRLRLHSCLRQRGSAFGAAFYGWVGNPALPSFEVEIGEGRERFASRYSLIT